MQDKKENITLEELKSIAESSEKTAREIRMLSRAFKKLGQAGLKEKTIVILLSESSHVGKSDVRAILQALGNLEREYLVEVKE
jgi:Ca2+-binding EF-hand superfamily protein